MENLVEKAIITSEGNVVGYALVPESSIAKKVAWGLDSTDYPYMMFWAELSTKRSQLKKIKKIELKEFDSKKYILVGTGSPRHDEFTVLIPEKAYYSHIFFMQRKKERESLDNEKALDDLDDEANADMGE